MVYCYILTSAVKSSCKEDHPNWVNGSRLMYGDTYVQRRQSFSNQTNLINGYLHKDPNWQDPKHCTHKIRLYTFFLIF